MRGDLEPPRVCLSDAAERASKSLCKLAIRGHLVSHRSYFVFSTHSSRELSGTLRATSCSVSTRGRTRTGTAFRPRDFKSHASTISPPGCDSAPARESRARFPQSRARHARRREATRATAPLIPARASLDAMCSVSANSEMFAKRSFRERESARLIASSTRTGTSGRTVRIEGAPPANIFATTACAFRPPNGVSPASISYNTVPGCIGPTDRRAKDHRQPARGSCTAESRRRSRSSSSRPPHPWRQRAIFPMRPSSGARFRNPRASHRASS